MDILQEIVSWLFMVFSEVQANRTIISTAILASVSFFEASLLSIWERHETNLREKQGQLQRRGDEIRASFVSLSRSLEDTTSHLATLGYSKNKLPLAEFSGKEEVKILWKRYLATRGIVSLLSQILQSPLETLDDEKITRIVESTKQVLIEQESYDARNLDYALREIRTTFIDISLLDALTAKYSRGIYLCTFSAVFALVTLLVPNAVSTLISLGSAFMLFAYFLKVVSSFARQPRRRLRKKLERKAT